MPRNGSGGYTLPLSDVVANTTILASWANATLADVAAALTASIAKDGQTQPTANLPMNNFKHTGAAAGTANGQYYRYDEIQSNVVPNLSYWGGTATGTVDASAITVTPAPTAYAAGQEFNYRSLGLNTSSAPTLNVNGLGAKTIKRNSGTTLFPWEIPDGLVTVRYDGTDFRLITPHYALMNRRARFFGYLTADQTITDATETKLTGWTERYDGGSNFNATTGVYTVPVAGLYRISYQAALLTNSGNPTEFFQARIANSADINTWNRGSSCHMATAINEYLVSVGSTLRHLQLSDEVCLWVRHRTGVDRDITGGADQYTCLSIELVDYYPPN